MTMKYKVVSTDPKNRSIVVQYYTDEIASDYATKLPGLLEMVQNSNPNDTPEWVADYVARQYPMGRYIAIDLPDPVPTGQDLIDLIIAATPVDHLDRVTTLLTTPEADLSEVDAMIGQEVAVADKASVEAAVDRIATKGGRVILDENTQIVSPIKAK